MKRMLILPLGVVCGLIFAAQNIFAQIEKSQICSGGVLNGKAIVLASPEYPAAAKAVAATGPVTVRVTIDEAGDVLSVDAVCGHTLLRAAAEKAARRSKFSPTILSGKRVKVTGVVVYNFEGGTPEAAEKAEIDAGVVNGRAKVLPAPEYTEDLKKWGAEETVAVEVVIDEKGGVTSARALPGDPRLREIAVRAARRAEFEPTLLQGKPITVRGILVYSFKASPDVRALGKASGAPDAEFPPAAKAVGAKGRVSVQVTINEKGSVISAKALSGHPLLRLASEKAAAETKFEPPVLNGERIEIVRIITYDFAGDAGRLVEAVDPKPKRD